MSWRRTGKSKNSAMTVYFLFSPPSWSRETTDPIRSRVNQSDPIQSVPDFVNAHLCLCSDSRKFLLIVNNQLYLVVLYDDIFSIYQVKLWQRPLFLPCFPLFAPWACQILQLLAILSGLPCILYQKHLDPTHPWKWFVRAESPFVEGWQIRT